MEEGRTMYDINECKTCQHSAVYAQGKRCYCYAFERFILESEVYDKPCGKFSVQQAVEADANKRRCLGHNPEYPLEPDYCPKCGGYIGPA